MERAATRLLIVRHGQAGGLGQPYGAESPLTDLGRAQARHIATALGGESGAQIFTSPYARARDTALPTGQRLGCAPVNDDRLREFRIGVEDEHSLAQILEERRYLMLWRPHDRDASGGESLADFQARVGDFLNQVVRRRLDRTAIIFTHGGTIAACMRWAYDLTPQHDWHSDVEIFNASITEIVHWPDGRHPEGAPHATAIRRLNDVRHLPPSLVTEN